MQKRKNEPLKNYRLAILIVVLITVAVLIFLFFLLLPEAWCHCVADDFRFEETFQAIEVTNNHVATLIAQTETAQPLVTGTPQP